MKQTRYGFVRPPRTAYLGRLGPLGVYLVDGERVRNALDVDFTMGGTNARWPFIPTGEMWVDDGLSEVDREATILHEARENALMSGRGMRYDEAHDEANKVERAYRKRVREQ